MARDQNFTFTSDRDRFNATSGQQMQGQGQYVVFDPLAKDLAGSQDQLGWNDIQIDPGDSIGSASRRPSDGSETSELDFVLSTMNDSDASDLSTPTTASADEPEVVDLQEMEMFWWPDSLPDTIETEWDQPCSMEATDMSGGMDSFDIDSLPLFNFNTIGKLFDQGNSAANQLIRLTEFIRDRKHVMTSRDDITWWHRVTTSRDNITWQHHVITSRDSITWQHHVMPSRDVRNHVMTSCDPITWSHHVIASTDHLRLYYFTIAWCRWWRTRMIHLSTTNLFQVNPRSRRHTPILYIQHITWTTWHDMQLIVHEQWRKLQISTPAGSKKNGP